MYVGQTKRQLNTRLKEHRAQIKNKNEDYSVITLHRLEGHEFDWDRVEILDRELSWFRRITSEMIYIKAQTNGINKQEDTINLNKNYFPLISKS